jgi:hypothetical protein
MIPIGKAKKPNSKNTHEAALTHTITCVSNAQKYVNNCMPNKNSFIIYLPQYIKAPHCERLF